MPDLAQSYARVPITAFSVGTFPMDIVVDFSDGTPGTLLSQTNINNGTHGANWGGWQNCKNGTLGVANTYSYVANHAVTFPGKIACGGSLYDGSEGQGMTFDFSAAPTDYDAFEIVFSITANNCIALYLAQFDTTPGGADYNNDTINISSNNFTVAQVHLNGFDGTRYIDAHSASGVGQAVTLGSQWVIVSLKHDGDGKIAEMYAQDAATLKIIGASQAHHAAGPVFPIVYTRFQSYLRGINQGVGAHRYKLLALRVSDLTWPVYPITVPDPTAVTGSQTGAGTVKVTWSSVCQVFLIERNTNGGGWTTLDPAYDWELTAGFYTDATVSAGQSVQYRITAVIGNQSSHAVSSNTVVVT